MSMTVARLPVGAVTAQLARVPQIDHLMAIEHEAML